jgi:hypothetical protein
MPSIAADCATARNAEAARVNQGGLECSSYAWQVGHSIYGFRISCCQEDSGLTSLFEGGRKVMKSFLNNRLSAQGWVMGYPLALEGKGETNE